MDKLRKLRARGKRNTAARNLAIAAESSEAILNSDQNLAPYSPYGEDSIYAHSDSTLSTYGIVGDTATSPEGDATSPEGDTTSLEQPKSESSHAHTDRAFGSEDTEDSADDDQQQRWPPRVDFGENPRLDFYDNVDSSENQGVERPSSVSEADSSMLNCPPRDKVYHGSRWLTFATLFLAVYALTMSTLYFVVALVRPTWTILRSDNVYLSPSTVTLLCTLVARTIDGAFITATVIFVGQVLSRRAIKADSTGMSIAEMSMRDWIVQPTGLFTNPRSCFHAGPSLLGVISITAAITAYIYTTATSALVSPILIFGETEYKVMYGEVSASYANPKYIENTCKTPVTFMQDPVYAASTCLAIEHCAQAYHNYVGYTQTWSAVSENSSFYPGAGEALMEYRPPPTANLYDNTTVEGSWVSTEYSNIATSFSTYSRMINNVTMTMPHSGIYQAARDEKNGIPQPTGLTGEGGFDIRAFVPSPSINVMCVNMDRNELAPLVYTDFPHAKNMPGGNSEGIPDWVVPMDLWTLVASPAWPNNSYGNSTVVDDLFGWGEKFGRTRPSFVMYPIDYNIVVNRDNHSSDTLYLLAKSANTANYTVCSLRSFLNPNCSTSYDVVGDTGSLSSNCYAQPDNLTSISDSVLAYVSYIPEAPPITFSVDWANVAIDLSNALSWNDGTVAGNASNARQLTQLIRNDAWLEPFAPSLAEALAVQTTGSLLLSAIDSPFVHYWQYNSSQAPDRILNAPVHEGFNSSIRIETYRSSYGQSWQKMFYIPLIALCLGSAFLVCYYIDVIFRKRGLVHDYTEPSNMFALALNSPPSELLEGCCAGGPQREQLGYPWHIREQNRSGHMYIEGQESVAPVQVSMVNDSDVELSPINRPSTLQRLSTFGTEFSFDTLSRNRQSATSTV